MSDPHAPQPAPPASGATTQTPHAPAPVPPPVPPVAPPARGQAARPAAPTTVGQTNAFALVSIITVFLMPIVGIIFGHLGLSQIKRTGDGGRGLALTAVIYGYASIVLVGLLIVVYVFAILAYVGVIFSAFSNSDLSSIEGY